MPIRGIDSILYSDLGILHGVLCYMPLFPLQVSMDQCLQAWAWKIQSALKLNPVERMGPGTVSFSQLHGICSPAMQSET